MTTITIYKPADLQLEIREGDPPVDQSALVAQLVIERDDWKRRYEACAGQQPPVDPPPVDPPVAIRSGRTRLDLSNIVSFVTIGYERFQRHICFDKASRSLQFWAARPLAYPQYRVMVSDGSGTGIERGRYVRTGTEKGGWVAVTFGDEPDGPYMLTMEPLDVAGNPVAAAAESYAPYWVWLDRNGTARDHPLVVFQNGNFDWTHGEEQENGAPYYWWYLVPKAKLKTREVPLGFANHPSIETAINAQVPGRFYGGEPFGTAIPGAQITRMNWAATHDVASAQPHRPATTKRGIVVTEGYQGYPHWHFHGSAPRQPMLDGPRGKAVIAYPTAMWMGHGGNIYGCEPFNFWRVNSDGKKTTFAGLRHTKAPHWEDMESSADPLASPFVEIVGDWDPAIPQARRFPWECWGLTFDMRTAALDRSLPTADHPPFGQVLQHSGEGPVAFLTCRFGRILRAQFHAARPNDPPTMTEFVTGLSDPWGLALDGDVLYVTERTGHRISMWSATDGRSLGNLIELAGSAPGGMVDSERRWQVPNLAAARMLNILAPEGLHVQDGYAYWGSFAQANVKRINLATREVEVCCRVPIFNDQSRYVFIALSDGTFGPRNAIFTTTFDNQYRGRPRCYVPDAGVDPSDKQALTHASGWWWTEDGPSVIRGPGGKTSVGIYPMAMAIGNGMLALGSSGHGLDVFIKATLGEPLPNIARAQAGRYKYSAKGYRQLHGNFGWGHVDTPLPWGEDADIDYWLELSGHRR